MANITDTVYKIRHLDEISQKDTFIHKLQPLIKLLVSIIYIIIVVSFDKYEILGLLPMIIYPIMIFSLGEIPVSTIIKRMLIVLPFVIGIGILNPIFDKHILFKVFDIGISAGWISFLSLIIKCVLTVLSALLLIATTGIEKIAIALRNIHVPKIFVIQILLTYRYISVLLEEGASIWTAYSLRAPNQKGIQHKAWGSLLGQLLIRTYDRGQRVYQAMMLRGFQGEYHFNSLSNSLLKDIMYLLIWITYFLMVRYYNIPMILGSILTGV